MNPIKAIKNQYVGVNAHLHSYWQARGGWHEFHTAHITHLAAALQRELLPRGYSAAIEHSLQIRRDDEVFGTPESDLVIYDESGSRPASSQLAKIEKAVASPIAEAVELMQERAEYRALAIHKLEEGARAQAVGWVELLSPSNKPGHSDAHTYAVKRQGRVHSGLVFVEIDYLNTSRPTFSHLRDGKPYRVIVIDPRPDYFSGMIYNYAFEVDDAIPTVDIPLAGTDVVRFDFSKPYERTLEELAFAYLLIDYAQPPLGMDHYSAANQLRIMARMQAITRAVRAGVDLEANAPLPTDSVHE